MSTISYEEKLFNAIKNAQEPSKSTYDLWKELGNDGDANDFFLWLKGTHAVVVTGYLITVDSWTLDTINGLYSATITNSEILENSLVNVNFNSASISEAINSGVLGYTDSTTGQFKLYSNFKPATDLTIDYAIIRQ